MWGWMQETLANLAMARKVSVEPERRDYFYLKLQEMDYSPSIAENAQLWMEIGDWTYRGIDPTIELSDFFPSDEQVRKVREKQARGNTDPGLPYQIPPTVRMTKGGPVMTESQREEWAIYIILVKEPQWGIQLNVPWIDNERPKAKLVSANGWKPQIPRHN